MPEISSARGDRPRRQPRACYFAVARCLDMRSWSLMCETDVTAALGGHVRGVSAHDSRVSQSARLLSCARAPARRRHSSGSSSSSTSSTETTPIGLPVAVDHRHRGQVEVGHQPRHLRQVGLRRDGRQRRLDQALDGLLLAGATSSASSTAPTNAPARRSPTRSRAAAAPSSLARTRASASPTVASARHGDEVWVHQPAGGRRVVARAGSLILRCLAARQQVEDRKAPVLVDLEQQIGGVVAPSARARPQPPGRSARAGTRPGARRRAPRTRRPRAPCPDRPPPGSPRPPRARRPRPDRRSGRDEAGRAGARPASAASVGTCPTNGSISLPGDELGRARCRGRGSGAAAAAAAARRKLGSIPATRQVPSSQTSSTSRALTSRAVLDVDQAAVEHVCAQQHLARAALELRQVELGRRRCAPPPARAARSGRSARTSRGRRSAPSAR